MRFFVFTLLAALALSAAPIRAQSSTDPGDLFVNAYMAVQQGEKAEQAGNLKQALTKLRSAATVLDQITARFPSWQPQIVDYRKTRTTEGIARLQEKIARSGPGKTDGEGLPSGDPLGLPQAGAGDKPLNFGDNPIAPSDPAPPSAPPARTPKARTAPTSADGDLFAKVEQRMKKLEEDLKGAKDEAAQLQKEKASLGQRLDEAANARTAADQKQQVLQKRADNAEAALMKAMADGKGDSDKIKALQADANATKHALRSMRIEADADTEYRQQLDDRYKSALSRIQALTQQRDTAKSASESVPGKIEGIQKQLDQAKKEKDDLSTKLAKTETELSKVTGERDNALAQVAKLQDAQKEIDKLVADNTALMAKLSDAQKTITQFKLEGEEKDKQIASLKSEVTSVKEQLAQSKRESAEYQRQMADLQTKLEESGKQLTEARAENTANAAEKKKMVAEIGVLRGIVLRQQKEEAVRAETRKAVLGELSGLEIHSKSLVKQIEFLAEPVVKLTEKERALFKKPELQVGDSEISIGGAVDAGAASTSAPAPVLDLTASASKPAEPPVAPVAPAPTIAANPPPATTPVPAPTVEVASTPVPTSKGRTADKSSKTAAAKTPEKNKIADQPLPTPENPPALSLTQQPPTVDSVPIPSSAPAQPAVGDLASVKPSTTLPPATSMDPATAAPPPPSVSGSRSSSVPDLPPELLSLARQGKDEFERGNYLEAEKIYRKILAKAPNSLYTLSNLGVVLFRAKKHKLAEESFKKAIAVAPEDAFSHCTLGIVYYDQGKYDEAVNELTKALAIDTKNATAHNYLGITASQKGWQEAAQKELETAVALDPNYADAHFNLAVVFATQTPPNKENARKFYQRATELGAERDTALEQLIK